MRGIPVRDRLLVRQDEESEYAAVGIVAPQTAQEKPKSGVVLEVGEGRILDNGQKIPMGIEVGAHVMFGKFSGVDVELNGETLKVLREDEVLLVLQDEERDGV